MLADFLFVWALICHDRGHALCFALRQSPGAFNPTEMKSPTPGPGPNAKPAKKGMAIEPPWL
jgi:hypothetical protein